MTCALQLVICPMCRHPIEERHTIDINSPRSSIVALEGGGAGGRGSIGSTGLEGGGGGRGSIAAAMDIVNGTAQEHQEENQQEQQKGAHAMPVRKRKYVENGDDDYDDNAAMDRTKQEPS